MQVLSLLSCAAVVTATTFTLSAYAPGTEVDGAVLNAAASAFYTGITGPATYCPIEHGCPEIGGTVVYDGLTAMAVMVPGGQQIYVASTGEVKYTAAHSGYKPLGSYLGGWFNQTVVWDCAPPAQVLNFLATDGSNAGGIALCPDVADFMTGTGASFQLYAKVPGFNLKDCVDIVGLTVHQSSVELGAWQYL
ncbi:uncharacterized protein B0I36DRAFT_365197 [Microdochium trichocladiopsis]|uniref:Uncharacterized protein n=1 Tax=Microdochium trichocladiopsis TaxID=1682393 RepID=A0A9P8Y2U9_9PEZI|nr:uncharacterized protein B0I36DRAFT_365197 [Microdochium trichocladiopsis]KAH7028081.1 hypothetical protein B0I36DRAFT_365197 [Microdochium trichocladiopsis]